MPTRQPCNKFFYFFKLKHNSHFYFAVISQTSGKYICVCLQVQPQMLAMLKQSAELPRKLLCKFSKHKAQTEDQPKLEKKNINGAPKGQTGKKKKKKKHWRHQVDIYLPINKWTPAQHPITWILLNRHATNQGNCLSKILTQKDHKTLRQVD